MNSMIGSQARQGQDGLKVPEYHYTGLCVMLELTRKKTMRIIRHDLRLCY